ncbi:hypothetical protein LDENG_00132340 [Lucifuga dentata]|nr:hypothetical protein LDENG_00132340 [Lucifuga dentata]
MQFNEFGCLLFSVHLFSLVPKVLGNLGSLSSFIKPLIRSLRVSFDQALALDAHVRCLTHSCFYHLRNIAKLSSIISWSKLEIIICHHSFLSFRLDCSNSVFTCCRKTSLDHLQAVQNAAPKLLTKSSKWSHVTPLLISLHWLPVKFRVQFKILV